jgi:hypothetical protein
MWFLNVCDNVPNVFASSILHDLHNVIINTIHLLQAGEGNVALWEYDTLW